MNRRAGSPRAGVVLVIVAALAGCGNGLPRDLTAHLAAHGIAVEPTRVHDPLSERGGYVVAPWDSLTATRIVAEFGLEQIERDAPQWHFAAGRAGPEVSVQALWGAWGRPSQFSLDDGGQFEFFYLLVTTDGLMYLLAEYAYG